MRRILDLFWLTDTGPVLQCFLCHLARRCEKEGSKALKSYSLGPYISSPKGSEKILKIGYSDDIVVYLNRKRIFSGKNALSYRDEDSLGTFGLNDQTQIHLNPGDNELLVAVTEYNGGWAFECELSPIAILIIVKPDVLSRSRRRWFGTCPWQTGSEGAYPHQLSS